jgi:CheY-like chemotaxis protein
MITRNAGQSRPRVLVADDFPQVLESVRGLLSTDFDVVATATDRLQAVDLALRLQPDVVVLDVAMPKSRKNPIWRARAQAKQKWLEKAPAEKQQARDRRP